ncbi:MAG TPA: SRPBCC family protein [Acidimicrobiales bacterium]|nr:SRPBCC family protein [Acidimicrobiales bacterium]
MATLTYSNSIEIARSPDDLYDMIADVTRMGEWSPVCKSCWWDEGASAYVGAWFTGHNETLERSWDTRSVVVAAERGREFAFVVNGTWIRWGYQFSPSGEGTVVTESWEFLEDGLEGFRERYGDDAATQIEQRRRTAHDGIAATLAALKKAAESN